ncbi:serine/threonine-protein kinase [Bacteroides sp.]|uniref:serine/threonine-protein kinase n=1 Tax=Bacteroides sp. TaxID=29523 RepID=UPI00258BCC43|nr:serine/threonine-protein kinase [Bacteroides sp.]
MIEYKVNINYREIKPLDNQGYNSRVFLIHDIQLDKEFVLKKILKDSIDPEAFFREARLVEKCQHKHILPIRYAGEDSDGNNIDIVMPLYKNGSLKNKITNGNSLTIKESLRYFIHIILGLHFVHSQRMVHFDLKPDNIMISDADEAVLADFGLAQEVDNNGIAQFDKIYGLHYTPEAILTGDRIGVQLGTLMSDIYQLGLTMYRVVNGFSSLEKQVSNLGGITTNYILESKFPDRKSYGLHVPSKVKTIINKCLSLNPLDKYKSALDILNDLSSIPNSNHLLWKQSINNDNYKQWIWQNDKFKVVLNAKIEDGSRYFVDVKKKNLISNNEQTLRKFCYTGAIKSEFIKAIKSAIKEYS